MFRTLIGAGVSLLALGAVAAPEITITSTPALPLENKLRNASFEEEKLMFWVPIPKDDNGIVIDKENAASGGQSLKIPGVAGKNINAYQSIKWETPVKAGEPIYVRVSAKKTDPDIDKKPAGLACQLYFADGNRSYIRMPLLPKEDYGWATFENIVIAPSDVTAATFYLCHYDQDGVQWYDDLMFQTGNVELTVSVKGDDLKQVTLRNSVTGTVFTEPASGTEFSKTLSVPGFGSYCVEVTDSKGMKTAKLYPEGVDANVAASDTVLPLTPVKRLVLAPLKPADAFKIELPDLTGKKVYLEFLARNQKPEGLAGYTSSLKVMVNGKLLGASELVTPKNEFTTASGKGGVVAGNNGYALYYNNSFYAISQENTYAPVSLESRNPFEFKLDVTALVKAGVNTIELRNSLQPNPKLTFDVYVENPRLVIE